MAEKQVIDRLVGLIERGQTLGNGNEYGQVTSQDHAAECKATHAQWDEFELSDVRTAVEFAEELILNHIEQ